MASPDPEGTIPEGDPTTPDAPTTGRWRLVAMIHPDGQEPNARLSDAEALATWTAVSALWHPAILAQAAELPAIEGAEMPSHPYSNEVRVLPASVADRLPSGFRQQADDVGVVLLEADGDRLGFARRVLGCMDDVEAVVDESDAVALDFLALGTARWWLRDLTIAMGHVDCLDVESLTRETLAGARAWRSGDHPAAVNRLRAAFELLTQARERFYPVDAYLVDLCLIDHAATKDALADALEARAPVTIVAPARAIEALEQSDPEHLAMLRDAITEGWADVAGGAYDETDEPLRPFESILWQYRHGEEVYRRLLDDRAVETFARRRFGLYPQLPQIARRFGVRFALHLALDDGRFPVPPETKRLWESPDGSHLESLMRPPVAADRPAQGAFLPWRLARTMKDDHVATITLVHWPSPLSGWFLDLRRVAAYSPVLARWTTLSDYFHLTDRPFEHFQPEPDEYGTPYLSQAVARRDPTPISRRVVHTGLRARFDSLSVLRSLTKALGGSEPEPSDDVMESRRPAEIEESLETGRLEDARAAISVQESRWQRSVAQIVTSDQTDGRPGYLILNTLGIPRRAAVLLPEASADLRPEGPLRASQFTEEGVWAVVDLPAYGYAWVGREPTTFDLSPAPMDRLGIREKTLRNESMEVEIDPATGGIRSLRALGEPAARLGQQLVIAGLTGPDGSTMTSQMRVEQFDVDYGGPALVQAVSKGILLDPAHDQALARFQQRYRLWSGRPVLEVDVSLSDLDPAWQERMALADPWSRFLSCRWAWADGNALLRRTCLGNPVETEAERPETPEVFDIATRRQRTGLIFGGLAHHRRHGARMLDTILIAGREECRHFRLGVVLDLEHPFHAAQDFNTPALVLPTESGPPRPGPAGWFFHIDNKAVAVSRVEPVEHSGDGRGWGVAFHVLETAGRPARCRLRLLRNPICARQTDFNDELVVDLPVDGDAVLLDLTPHEMARIDVTLG